MFHQLDGDDPRIQTKTSMFFNMCLTPINQKYWTSAKACLKVWQMLVFLWVLVLQVTLLLLQLQLSEPLGMDTEAAWEEVCCRSVVKFAAVFTVSTYQHYIKRVPLPSIKENPIHDLPDSLLPIATEISSLRAKAGKNSIPAFLILKKNTRKEP